MKGNLDLLLLSILASQPSHGYEVICQLRERSGGLFDLPEGTVYPALHRLEHRGLLSSAHTEASGRKRRVYRLTAAGVRALDAERGQWSRFSDALTATLRPLAP